MPLPKLLQSVAKRYYRLRRDPIIAHRFGGRFLLDPRNWIDNRILAGAPYEIDQLRQATELITSQKLDGFIDVGANIGIYSVLLGRLPQIEQVLAFEPMRRNYAQLHANLYLNHIEAKVEPHRRALGASPGEATLHIDPRSTGLARLALEGAERDPRVFTRNETVEVIRFDDHHPFTGRRLFLKIDVEGHAAGVLQGMRQLFARNYVVTQVELTQVEKAPVTDFFRELGYRTGPRLSLDQIFLPA